MNKEMQNLLNYNQTRYYNVLQNKINVLQECAGCSIDELIQYFSAGWKLSPPLSINEEFGDIKNLIHYELRRKSNKNS